ncbi:MAG: hypothetical protein B7C24_09480 [Bacteroidetes bacterium 4572_77]|nr:MAG: hypothetical protein B7C24_09480 [Bacteroidetes bacterium 4572_77]
MKKLLLSVFVLVLGVSALAQVIPNIGIKGGLTTSSLTTNLSENFASENVLGYQFGAFARIHFGKLYVQPEFVYNHRSTKLEYEITPIIDGENQKVGMRSEIKMGTFDIPVLLGFKIIKTKLMNVRIFAGPEISFSTNQKLSYDYTTGDGENFEGQPGELSSDDFNKTTWYLQAGAGIDVLMFTFDVRYEKGLSDIYSGQVSNGIKMEDVNLKNNVWVFSLGIKFL